MSLSLIHISIQNLDIVKVDPELNMIAVRGAIPGPKGGLVPVSYTHLDVYKRQR